MRIKTMLFKIGLFITALLFTNTLLAQKQVTGSVHDASGQPIAGSTISIKGSTVGTQTDANGDFKIEVTNSSSKLVVSSVGFEPQEITVGNRSNIAITLKSSVSTLNEVVVTGYSSQRKRDITGSVAVVNTSELKQQPASSPIEALQGKATGVQIINDGSPGSTPQIRIRGNTSINNNDPLYVIDGMPYQGKLSWLNSDDIESMSVLKDASASSIYGSRANNGVVIITI